MENILNEKTNFDLDLNKNNKVFLNERKYSDDMSSIDSNLINENDNLSIPENFQLDNYSPSSTADTDTTIQNDLDLYKKIEQKNKSKTKSGSSEGRDAAKTKNKPESGTNEREKIKTGQNKVKEAVIRNYAIILKLNIVLGV